jgi:hypothetical protein
MYILVLSKIEVVQEQKKVDRNIGLAKKIAQVFLYQFMQKKKKKNFWPTQYKEIKWKIS